MAFHLHRLGLVGRALRDAGYNVHDAADLAAGRTALNSMSATGLAERLGIAVQQLSRELSDDETRAWSFYRRAAADPQHVWRNAQQAWRTAGVNDQQAADIMGVNPSVLRLSRIAATRYTLSFERASKLTTALNIVEGPELFLPSPKRPSSQPSR